MSINKKYASNIVPVNFLLIIASILIFTCCRATRFDATLSDRAQDHLKGQVLSVRTETSKLIKQAADYSEGPKEIVATKTYDSNGNLSVEHYTAADDAPLYSARHSYDEDGRKTERVILDPNGATRTKREFKYDAKGNAIEWSEFDAYGAMRSKCAYVYDDKNRVIEWTMTNARGAVVDRWLYAYDDNGNRREETRYFADNTVDKKFVFRTDENGNRIEMAKYNGVGESEGKQRYAYEFDSTGNWTKRTTFKLIDDVGKSDLEPLEVTYRKIAYN